MTEVASYVGSFFWPPAYFHDPHREWLQQVSISTSGDNPSTFTASAGQEILCFEVTGECDFQLYGQDGKAVRQITLAVDRPEGVELSAAKVSAQGSRLLSNSGGVGLESFLVAAREVAVGSMPADAAPELDERNPFHFAAVKDQTIGKDFFVIHYMLAAREGHRLLPPEEKGFSVLRLSSGRRCRIPTAGIVDWPRHGDGSTLTIGGQVIPWHHSRDVPLSVTNKHSQQAPVALSYLWQQVKPSKTAFNRAAWLINQHPMNLLMYQMQDEVSRRWGWTVFPDQAMERKYIVSPNGGDVWIQLIMNGFLNAKVAADDTDIGANDLVIAGEGKHLGKFSCVATVDLIRGNADMKLFVAMRPGDKPTQRVAPMPSSKKKSWWRRLLSS